MEFLSILSTFQVCAALESHFPGKVKKVGDVEFIDLKKKLLTTSVSGLSQLAGFVHAPSHLPQFHRVTQKLAGAESELS